MVPLLAIFVLWRNLPSLRPYSLCRALSFKVLGLERILPFRNPSNATLSSLPTQHFQGILSGRWLAVLPSIPFVGIQIFSILDTSSSSIFHLIFGCPHPTLPLLRNLFSNFSKGCVRLHPLSMRNFRTKLNTTFVIQVRHWFHSFCFLFSVVVCAVLRLVPEVQTFEAPFYRYLFLTHQECLAYWHHWNLYIYRKIGSN